MAVSRQLGYGDDALAAEYDDGHPAWEDTEEEDDQVLENRWQHDDLISFGKNAIPTNEQANLAEKLIKTMVEKQQLQTMRIMALRWYRSTWKKHLRRVAKKVKELDQKPTCPPVPPHKFFSPKERSALKTLVTTGHFDVHGDPDWIWLPGSAAWWENEDLEKHWRISSNAEARARHLAWLIMAGHITADEFHGLMTSGNELMAFKIPETFDDMMRAMV